MVAWAERAPGMPIRMDGTGSVMSLAARKKTTAVTVIHGSTYPANPSSTTAMGRFPPGISPEISATGSITSIASSGPREKRLSAAPMAASHM